MLQGKKQLFKVVKTTILFILPFLFILGKRPKIQKGEAFSNEANFASNLGKALRHPDFGFHTLNYTVSEACKHIKIKVLNKNAVACSVGIRTKDSTAKAGKDYNAIPES